MHTETKQIPVSKEVQKQKDKIIRFLALFNQIDKHLDKILGEEKFLPYNEKIKRILHERTYISWFVRLHQYQLKYFGEIRNQITHGIKLNGHNYIIPTDYAMDQLERYAAAIKKPPRCSEIFGKKVFSVNGNDTLWEVIQEIKKNRYTHIPVYDDHHHFLGILLLNELLIWIFDHSNTFWVQEIDQFEDTSDITTWKNKKVKDLQLFNDRKHILFVHKNKNIYEIDEIFTSRKMKNKELSIVLITDSGHPDELARGIITPSDVAIIDSFVMH